MKNARMNKNLTLDKTNGRLSYILLKAYAYEKYPLESHFLCLLCHGISIHPLVCKHCGYSYCEKCFNSIADSKICCNCKNSYKIFFEKEIHSELNNTYYLIQDNFNSNNIILIQYSETLFYENNCTKSIIPAKNEENSFNIINQSNQYCIKIEEFVYNHKDRFDFQLSKKCAKNMNFNFIKGYKLDLIQKIIGEKEANFMKIDHLNKIKIEKCLWNTEFLLQFYQVITFNRKRMSKIEIQVDYDFQTNIKSYVIILNALSACSNLKEISLIMDFRELVSSSFPKTFYSFISKCFLLKEINFNNLIFYDHMNYKGFHQCLIYLEKLTLYCCNFHINCFESIYINNFPNLKRLKLNFNTLIESSLNDSNQSELNPFLKSATKFPCLLEIKFGYEFNSFENIIFHKLILCKNLTIISLNINFYLYLNNEKIQGFIKFLKSSKIRFLTLENLINTEGFDSSEFFEFLRSSDSLIGLFLSRPKLNNFNVKLLLQEVSSNKSIKVLFLCQMYLASFSSNLYNLISKNDKITTLILAGSSLKIDIEFIDALLKSKSILYLLLNGIIIEDGCALKLSELNLKGINVDYARIIQPSKNLIYSKIPKIKYFHDLQDYEIYLNK